jgi:hypothetical protein
MGSVTPLSFTLERVQARTLRLSRDYVPPSSGGPTRQSGQGGPGPDGGHGPTDAAQRPPFLARRLRTQAKIYCAPDEDRQSGVNDAFSVTSSAAASPSRLEIEQPRLGISEPSGASGPSENRISLTSAFTIHAVRSGPLLWRPSAASRGGAANRRRASRRRRARAPLLVSMQRDGLRLPRRYEVVDRSCFPYFGQPRAVRHVAFRLGVRRPVVIAGRGRWEACTAVQLRGVALDRGGSASAGRRAQSPSSRNSSRLRVMRMAAM